MINSDGGSTDGTPELIRAASFTEADMVQTSHSLRTLHRVVAPYHGLPGKHTALRTVFAAGELTQAKVVVVIDPGGPATTAERVTELISPIAALRGRVPGAALSPASSRRRPDHAARPPAGARPVRRRARRAARRRVRLLRAFCRRTASSRTSGIRRPRRFAIDLWLRTEAVAERFTVGQIWRPATTAAGARTTLREAVHQVVLVADREPCARTSRSG